MQANAAENASVCISQRCVSIDWFGYEIVQCPKRSVGFQSFCMFLRDLMRYKRKGFVIVSIILGSGQFEMTFERFDITCKNVE